MVLVSYVMQQLCFFIPVAPNFDQQDTGPFYNWAGNKEGHLPCTAISNPLPVFSWFKDDKEITDVDSFYSIVREEGEVTEDKPQFVTSKLMVCCCSYFFFCRIV